MNFFLEKVLLHSEYQPLISSANQKIFAYEALMRNTIGLSPLEIIERAKENGFLYDLDIECITNAIKGYPPTYLENFYLFINIFPSTIVHDQFESFIHQILINYPWIKKGVVFEINEDEKENSYWGMPLFLKRLSFLKNKGFRIAFDDIALSKLSLKRVETLTPDFVKLDHTYSKDLSSSMLKQQVISYFLEYTNESVKLVLEGIESKEDLNVAKRLGVSLLQGYYFAKPKRLE